MAKRLVYIFTTPMRWVSGEPIFVRSLNLADLNASVGIAQMQISLLLISPQHVFWQT